MKFSTVALGLLFLAVPILSEQPRTGKLCVEPNSSKAPALVSPGQSYNPATLTVRIDKGTPVPWPHKESLKIGDLDLSKRHLVVLTSGGKSIQSFWFHFSDYGSTVLCLAFDGYHGVQLDDPKNSRWCKCK
jgi:hypothetical protein